MHHFIGKDIVNFHGLFWPAVLHGAGFRAPTRLHVNGYLMVNGEKMSKSRGTFIMARTYLDQGIAPEALRYYFATKTAGGVDDVDLNFADFTARVNSDLVGKFVNLASRCAGFIEKRFDGELAAQLPDPAMYARFVEQLAPIAQAYERNEAATALRLAMVLADEANKYIDEHKPWVLAKQEGADAQLQAVCTQGLNLFRVLNAALKPVLPRVAEQAEAFLAAPVRGWSDLAKPLLGHRIASYAPLFTRIDTKQIDTMIESSKESLKPADTTAAPPSSRPTRAAAPNRRLRMRMPPQPPTSASTTSPSSTCAWARCWPASSSTVRTSCCASNSTPARWASARSSPASARPTANPKSWSAAAWCSSPTWRRARCASASARG